MIKSTLRHLGFAFLAVILVSSVCFAQGLAERRAIKECQDSKFPEFKSQIEKTVRPEIVINVDWTKIAKPGEAEHYLEDEYWTNIYFKPLVGALEDVAKDEMGKTALTEKLKEIHVTYDESTAPASNYPNGVSFESGKLKINFAPWSNASDIDERKVAIQKALEANL